MIDFNKCNTCIGDESKPDIALRKLHDIQNNMSYYGEVTDKLIKAREDYQKLSDEGNTFKEEIKKLEFNLREAEFNNIIDINFVEGRKGNWNPR